MVTISIATEAYDAIRWRLITSRMLAHLDLATGSGGVPARIRIFGAFRRIIKCKPPDYPSLVAYMAIGGFQSI
jgi:hypothetical protein